MDGLRKHGWKKAESVSLADLVESTGIQMAMWAKDMVLTDAAYAQDWIEKTGIAMVTLSEMLNIFYQEHREVLEGVVVELPEHFMMRVIPNPLHVPDVEKPFEEGKGDATNTWGDKNSIDDLPF